MILCNLKLSKKMWSILASSFRLDFLFWIISSLFPKKNWNMFVVLKREFLVRAINLLCEVAKDKNAKYGLKLEMTWHYFFSRFLPSKKIDTIYDPLLYFFLVLKIGSFILVDLTQKTKIISVWPFYFSWQRNAAMG